MAGYQKQCHDLYKELVNMAAEASKVVSVTEALGMIAAYVIDLLRIFPIIPEILVVSLGVG